MFRKVIFIERSRLNLTDNDFQNYQNQTGLSYEEIKQIYLIFDEKGGVLNKLQFRNVFEYLNKKWLGNYTNSSAISDLVFRAFDKSEFK